MDSVVRKSTAAVWGWVTLCCAASWALQDTERCPSSPPPLMPGAAVPRVTTNEVCRRHQTSPGRLTHATQRETRACPLPELTTVLRSDRVRLWGQAPVSRASAPGSCPGVPSAPENPPRGPRDSFPLCRSQRRSLSERDAPGESRQDLESTSPWSLTGFQEAVLSPYMGQRGWDGGVQGRQTH